MPSKLPHSLRWTLAVALLLALGQPSLADGAAPVAAASPPTAHRPSAMPRDPGAGERFFYAQRAGRGGKLPPDYLLKARQQLLDEIRSAKMPVVGQKRGTKISSSTLPAQATTIQGSWSLIGPAPISGGIVGGDSGPYPIAGRVTALAVQDLNTVYLGAADGGVWKTTDGGASWSPITDNVLVSSLSVGAIAIDPNNASTIYVGLGEQNFNVDVGSLAGLGILKSTDGGSTWGLSSPAFLVGQRIGRIAVDPNNSNNVYAAVSNGLAFSTDGGTTWQQAFANQQPPPPFANLPVTDVVVDSTSTRGKSTVYFAVGSTDGNANNGVWATQLKKGQLSSPVKEPGTGGNLFPTGVGRIRLAISRTSPAALYAIAANPNGTLRGVWNTFDGGANWNQQADPDNYAYAKCSQCNYSLDIEVFPTTVNGSYVVAALTLDLFISTNSGAGWTNVSQIHNDGSNTTHADQHAFVFVPGNSNLYYLGNDGGVYSGNVNALAPDNAGLAITQFYRGAAPPVGKASAIGGSQDTGTVSYTGAPGWNRVVSSDGGYTAIDYNSGSNAYATIAASPQIHVYRSTAGVAGAFTESDNGITPADPAQFIYPMIMDPATPSTLYLGTNHLYQSTNGGASWQEIAQDFGAGAISAIAIAPSSPTTSRTIYVGTPNAFWVSTNGGATWSDLSANFPAAGRYISSIAVSPTQTTVAYVTVSTVSQAGTGYVWKTTDGGNTWTDLTGNLPNAAVSAIQVHPRQPQSLYIASDTGVYESAAADGNWLLLTPGNNGMPGVIVDDVVLNRAGTELFAFTHGRGAYVADVAGVPGNPWAWGDNSSYQIGDGTNTARLTPVAVYGLTNVTAVAGGNKHVLALRNDGTVWGWGYNNDGELGQGSTSQYIATPVQVQNLGDVVAIAAGWYDSYALKRDGTVWAWGGNAGCELGTGDLSSSSLPRQVSGLTNVVAIASGGDNDVGGLAVKADGNVWYWGDNSAGEIGNGSWSFDCIATPTQVPNLSNVTSAAMGGFFILALKADGTVWGWGKDPDYQLAMAPTAPCGYSDSCVLTPTQVPGITGVTALAGSDYHSVALKSDGTVWAWGSNSFGESGQPHSPNDITSPTQVSGIGGVTAIVAGSYQTYALKSDGTEWAWGANYNGDLGDGTTTERDSPVQVSGLTGVIAIGASEVTGYAVQSN